MKLTRRTLIGGMIGAGATALGGTVLANTGSQLPAWGDQSGDGYKAGPFGPADPGQIMASERPVYMSIPNAEVDAEVETNFIVDGQMKDPTGAWIVAWYEGTGLLHEKRRNMLFSGHVDYWGVGPSVFRNVASLEEGAEITITGELGGTATYAVEYVERIRIAELTAEKMQEITAPTPYEAITLITCSGEFDYAAKEYLQRDVIRARLKPDSETGDPLNESGSDAAASTPQAEATASAGEQTAKVNTDGVNVRPEASTAGAPVAVLNSGTDVTITGSPVDADGHTWYPVRLEDGTEGWIVKEYLDLP